MPKFFNPKALNIRRVRDLKIYVKTQYAEISVESEDS